MDNRIKPSTPLLRIENLTVTHKVSRDRIVQAVTDVSFDIGRGEILGLVGESGCGKSSLARAIAQIPAPDSGQVLLDGIDLTRLNNRDLRQMRSRIQMIFQEPLASLNPVKTIGSSVGLPLRIAGSETADRIRKRVCDALSAVGLDPGQIYGRKPAQLSGGQCQRAAIARALVNQPELLICDEPTASLDVSIQAQIINLLRDLNESSQLTLLFISHDLALVKNIADRVCVMYQGQLCEQAPSFQLFDTPLHPYTAALVASVSRNASPDQCIPASVAAQAKDTGALPCCRFRALCPRAMALCAEKQPELREIVPGHFVACHFPDDTKGG